MTNCIKTVTIIIDVCERMICLKNLKIKFLTLVLTFVIFLTAFPSTISAVWDGYVPDENEKVEKPVDDSGRVVLFDMNDIDTLLKIPQISPSQKYTKDAKYTAHWDDHRGNIEFTFPDWPSDWSMYDGIEVNIYSAAATNASIAFYWKCKQEIAGKTSRFTGSIKLDWVGWKNFKLYFGKEISATNSPNRAYVNTFVITAKSNRGGSVHDESDVYIDTVYGLLKDEGKAERDAQTLYEASDNAIAFYDNIRFVYKDHEQKPIDENNFMGRSTVSKGRTHIPFSFFSKHFGAETSADNGVYTIKKGDMVITLSENSSAYTLNGKTKNFATETFFKDDIFYVPATELFEVFGYKMKRYGEMTVFGQDKNFEILDSNNEIVELYKTATADYQPTPEDITEEDFRILKARYKRSMVGDENMDLTNPYIEAIVKNNESTGKAVWDKMNTDEEIEKIGAVFADAPPETSSILPTESGNILKMAKAWGTYGSAYYKDPELLKDIKRAFYQFYDKLYGEDEINGVGWRAFNSDNWHNWYKSTPKNLADALVIIGDEIPLEERRKYLEPGYYARRTQRTAMTSSSASSRLTVGISLGLAADNAETLCEVVRDYGIYYAPSVDKNGYQEDYCYIFHTHFPYSSGYGINQLGNQTEFNNVLVGTTIEYMSKNKNKYLTYLLNTYLPNLRNGRLMIMFGGRNLGGVEDYYSGTLVLECMMNAIGSFSKEDDELLKSIVKSHALKSNTAYVFSKCNVDNVMLLGEILADDSVIPYDNYTDCRVYWSGDRVSQTRPDYSVGIAMCSVRIGNYESINGDNTRGWYTGDGAVYVYNDSENRQYYPAHTHANGNKYPSYHKDLDFHKYPGTTEDTQHRERVSIALSQTHHPSRSFVGGVQVDNDYAVAAMDFKSYNYTSVSQYATTSYGSGLPYHKSSLKAHKSWFLFDDEVVCLGADITAKDGFDVNTYLDNRLLFENSGDTYGLEDIVVDGTLYEKVNAYTKEVPLAKWVSVESEGGYYFPDGEEITLNKRVYEEGKASYLEMWINHGLNPYKQDYAYVILPNKSPQQTEEYSKKPDIEVLANTTAIQAVREKNLGLTGYIFWQAGTFNELTTDQALVMTVEETDFEYILRISDPTQVLQRAKVKIARPLKLKEKADIATVVCGASETEIEYDLSKCLGQTFVVKFSK